jgi:negative regulator of flagellin synthesis FlgM
MNNIGNGFDRVNNVQKLQKIYNKNINAYNKTDSTIANRKDEVSISPEARELQIAMKALRDVDDIRKDRVEELEKRYQSGTYNVSGAEIVDAVIKSSEENKTGSE